MGTASPGNFSDLTGWECFVNSHDLEHEIPVAFSRTDDGEPWISHLAQIVFLRQGTALGLAVRRRAAGAEPPRG